MSGSTKRRRISSEEDRAIPDSSFMYDVSSDFASDFSPPRMTLRTYGRTLSPIYDSDTTVVAPNRAIFASRGSPRSPLNMAFQNSPRRSPRHSPRHSPRRSPGLSPISRRSSTSTNRTVPASPRSPSRIRSPRSRSSSRASSARGRARSAGVRR